MIKDMNNCFPDNWDGCQRASDDDHWYIDYASQFVQNELVVNAAGGMSTSATYSPLSHQPIIPGTVFGTVYHRDKPIQTFVVSTYGTFTFRLDDKVTEDIQTMVVCGVINYKSGEIGLTWTNPPGANHLVVSYEYNMECEKTKKEKMKNLNGVLVFYIDVGQLSSDRLPDFIASHKETNKALLEKLENNGYEALWFPVRNAPTRVEVIPIQ